MIRHFNAMSIAIVAGVAAMTNAAPASANVYELSPQGFVIRHQVEVPVSADAAWDALVRPAKWWSSGHSYSGDAKNLSLDAKAGGCFCEVLPNKASPNASPRGSVEHMRVVYVEQARALRMFGALGPLQAEAVNGALTVFLKPVGGSSTQIMWEYVVGGYLRTDAETTAAGVDRVLGEQVARLARSLGAKGSTSSVQEGAASSGSRTEAAPSDAPREEPGKTDRPVQDRRFDSR